MSHARAIFLVALLLLVPIFLRANVASFVVPSSNIFIPNVRSLVTLESKNSQNEKEAIAETLCLEIRTSSPSGNFYANRVGKDSFKILILTMSKNSARRSFYYEDAVLGFHVLSFKAALKLPQENRSCSRIPVSEWNVMWRGEWSFSVSNQAHLEPVKIPEPKKEVVSPMPSPKVIKPITQRVSPKNDNKNLAAVVEKVPTKEDFVATSSVLNTTNESEEQFPWWTISFIVLLLIAVLSVFIIKRPVYNQANEFTIEE